MRTLFLGSILALQAIWIAPSVALADWNQGRTKMGVPPEISNTWSLPLLLTAFQAILGVVVFISFVVLLLSLFFTLIHFVRNKSTGKGSDLTLYSFSTLLLSILLWTLLSSFRLMVY